MNSKKFYEFLESAKSKQLAETTLFSFTEAIQEKEYYELIEKLINSRVISFYWNYPIDDVSFFAYDEIFSLKQSVDRFQQNDLDIFSSKIFSNHDKTLDQKHPLFVGGIKFPSSKKDNLWKDFDSSKWFIPRILLLKRGEEYFTTVNAFGIQIEENDFLEKIENIFSGSFLQHHELINSDSAEAANHSTTQDSGLAHWTTQVDTCLRNISEGKLQKIVLARFLEIEFPNRQIILSHLHRLEKKFKNCYTFAFKNGDSIFFGASPERLLKISDGFLETDALAGSIQRGASIQEDEMLEHQLLQSKKDLAEHKSVVDFLINNLTPLTEKILFDSQPSIKKLANIQHLHSQIKAKLKKDTTIFSLIRNLHPTPAVCGFPSDIALELIDKIEEFDRGLYAGVLGWFNLYNEGEFIVGLRSALLKGNTLRAYAGCGIVNGSDPVSEFKETELKLKPILSLFTNEIANQP